MTRAMRRKKMLKDLRDFSEEAHAQFTVTCALRLASGMAKTGVALSECFVWHTSPQGYDYWKVVNMEFTEWRKRNRLRHRKYH